MANVTVTKEGLSQRISRFMRECWSELKKTSWPSPEELKKSTMLELAAMAIVTVWIGGLDAILGLITRNLLHW